MKIRNSRSGRQHGYVLERALFLVWLFIVCSHGMCGGEREGGVKERQGEGRRRGRENERKIPLLLTSPLNPS